MMDWQAYGDRGVLLRDLQKGLRSRLIDRFEQTLPEGCREFVIGYDSILLIGSVTALSRLAEALRRETDADAPEPRGQNAGSLRKIPVRYDGPDLHAIAEATGLTVRELIRVHSKPTYTVYMMGFAPGFPYLEGLDPHLHLARRTSPRNHIPPGAVAIGGPHAGIYSVASPGGWHLLGQTDLPLFRPEAAEQPNPDVASVFTLKPGDRVRFEAIEPKP
ncbi:MAG: carboxyltransferase domain-containing protein [Verrucomicrobia bacterium]|jgi:KipI family sensor histidine kinase inhibitor|nr:carboxyltransferase domain-containing protein [Verrucomicrobiota bacterium]